MDYYTETELLDYDTYLKTVKQRIKRLNEMTDTYILISDVDITDVNNKHSRKGRWTFIYEIETTPKIMGHIIYTDYHTWKREKTVRLRERKLKLLGI